MTEFDAIIIGTGQAGPSLARRLANAGMKVAIAERKRFGGTCINTGCMPTKTLVASAYVAHQMRRSAEFGIAMTGEISVDMARVKARKDAISRGSSEGLEKMLKSLENCTVLEGHARFISPEEVAIGDARLSAKRIFINVGGRALIPEIDGLGEVPFLTNSSILDLDFVPPHLLILGGSYVGLEFGQIYRRFGGAVSVVEMGERLIAREDVDVSEAVTDILRGEGVQLHLGATTRKVRREQDEIVLCLETPRRSYELRGSHLLLAIGRRPNTDDLGLDRAGIRKDDRGYIIVDDQLHATQPGVWALGECNGRGAFTHTAYNDFQIVAGEILDKETRRVSDRITAYALFTDPPLARIGLSESDIRRSSRPALMAKLPMTRVSRAVEKGETQGFMKIMVDRETEEILGSAILGTGGDEAIHGILDMMYAKASYQLLKRAVHIHPTVSELIPPLLEGLAPLGPAGSDRRAGGTV